MTLPPPPPELRPFAYVIAVNGIVALIACAIWAIERDLSAADEARHDPCSFHACCGRITEDDMREHCTYTPPARCAEIPVGPAIEARVTECARPLAGCSEANALELVLEISPTGGLADVTVVGADVAATECVRRRLQHLRFEPGDDEVVVQVRVPVDGQPPLPGPGAEWTPRRPEFSHARARRKGPDREWCRVMDTEPGWD